MPSGPTRAAPIHAPVDPAAAAVEPSVDAIAAPVEPILRTIAALVETMLDAVAAAVGARRRVGPCFRATRQQSQSQPQCTAFHRRPP
jgi:hypothetical protein